MHEHHIYRELKSAVDHYRMRPTDEEHERLRSLVEALHGPAAAEFFDVERQLPLAHANRVLGPPWPMERTSAFMYQFLLGSAAFIGATYTSLVLMIEHGANVLILLMCLAVGLLFYIGVTFLAGFLIPWGAWAERRRLLNVFEQIVERHRRELGDRSRAARRKRLEQYEAEDAE